MSDDTTIRADVDAIEVSEVRVSAFTADEFTARVIEMATTPGVDVAVGVNAHVCNLARRDARMRALLQETTNYADGQSVVWAARALGGHLPQRLATTDTARPVLRAAAAAGIPVYFFGAAEGVARRAAERMRVEVPGLQLRTHHGYVAEDRVHALLADIADHGTGILFVGLGDPRQQTWVDDHRDRLPGAVLTCGGLFDWLSGSNRRAPGWMISAGLEWLWRLLIEPRRLAHRYLVGNPSFMLAVARQRLRQRKSRP